MSDGAGLLKDLGLDFQDAPVSDEAFEVFTQEAPPTETPAAPDQPPIFSVQRGVFVSMVEQAMLVVPLKDFYPALKNLVLHVDQDKLTVTGGDGTSTVVSATTTVRVERPGRVLIGALRFASIVRRCAGAEITVRCEGTSMDITSGAASWNLRVAAVQDYPPLPEISELTWTIVDRDVFERALSGVRYAAGSDEAKDYLMQLDIAGGVVTAADSVRFAQVQTDLDPELVFQLPVSGADLLMKMLARNDAKDFRVADSEFHVVAEIGPTTAPDRLISAHLMSPFPQEMKAAIHSPMAENRDELTIDIDELTEALKRAVPTADEETGAVCLSLANPEPGKLTLLSRNRYGDQSSEVIDAPFVVAGTEKPAKARKVIVNHAHLVKALSAISAATSAEDTSTAKVLLGEGKSKSKPSFVLLQDTTGKVQSVLSQVRSDWIS